MKSSLLFLFIILFTGTAVAQDKIYKKDQTIIEGKVTEIGINEVKYYDNGAEDGPLITIGVEELIKVVLKNGKVYEFKDLLTDPATYADDRKTALKLNFLSPLMENLSFSLERSIRPGRSYETELGLIGIGFNTDAYNKSSGVYIGAGYKFLRTPDFYAQRFKYSHILKGGYIKPQVLVSIFKTEYSPYFYPSSPDPKAEENVVAGAFVLTIGHQSVYDNAFLLDYSIGIGYGFSSQNDEYDDYYSWNTNHYGFLMADKDVPLAVKFNLKIGLLLNNR